MRLILNHKVFLSVGHDEYWSGAQRANVEAARAAGVAPGVLQRQRGVLEDALGEQHRRRRGTPYRTLVSYKETHANAKIDPAGAAMWTGTWRDPRFSPPADGGRPENALTGTIFMVNAGTRPPSRVPAADGKTAVLAEHDASPTLAAGAIADAARWARSATSGTRTSTTASVPPG